MHKIIQQLVSIGFVVTLIIVLCTCTLPPLLVKANNDEEELLTQTTEATAHTNETIAENPIEETPDESVPSEPTVPSEVIDNETETEPEETVGEITNDNETTSPTEPEKEDENIKETTPTVPQKPTEPKPTEPTIKPTTPEPEVEPTEQPEVVEPKPETPTEPPAPEETNPSPTEPTPTEPEVTQPTDPQPTEPPVETKPAEPTVNYTEVDEMLYTTASSLNVRKGPGTQYDKVTSLSMNTQVHRIAIGDNGWSKIELDGQILYVHSSYLSKDKVVVSSSGGSKYATVAEEIEKRGITCRLTIPSVGVNVACFWSTGSNLQTLVDNTDSAAFFPRYNDVRVIADHRHQGFSAMKSSTIGTKAYLDYGSYVETYTCIANFKGHNTGAYLTDNDGNNVSDLYPGKLVMYTCNENWQNVTITIWE